MKKYQICLIFLHLVSFSELTQVPSFQGIVGWITFVVNQPFLFYDTHDKRKTGSAEEGVFDRVCMNKFGGASAKLKLALLCIRLAQIFGEPHLHRCRRLHRLAVGCKATVRIIFKRESNKNKELILNSFAM